MNVTCYFCTATAQTLTIIFWDGLCAKHALVCGEHESLSVDIYKDTPGAFEPYYVWWKAGGEEQYWGLMKQLQSMYVTPTN